MEWELVGISQVEEPEEDATCLDEEVGYLVELEVVNEVGVPLEEGQEADLEVDLVEGQGVGQEVVLVAEVVVVDHAGQAIPVA